MLMTATLLERLQAAWARSDQLFALLPEDALRERPIALRHPFIFYLGHLPAFGWNQVCRGVLARPTFAASFDDLFERGIDPPDTGPAPASPTRWPDVGEILSYRNRVRDALLCAFDEVAGRRRDDVMARGGRVYSVVLEHELMHHETLLYMLQQLDHSRKRPAPEPVDAPAPRGRPVPRVPVAIPAGRAVLGARFEALPFGWDNEFPQALVDVPAFEIDSRPVTNEEFLEFVADGGYEQPALWSAEGWAWQQGRGRAHPQGWIARDGGWLCRGAFRDVPFEQARNWPASVSWAEAAAFARWSGARLPTEAEFVRAAYGAPDGSQRSWPWGEAAPSPRHGNFDFHRWAPAPVGSHPAGASAFGVHELVGNGWEWTSTRFAPHPGFTAYMPHYAGYSADFFDGHHYVLLGGSWATDRDLLRRSFRNWYQPHYPYVFSKFRLARGGLPALGERHPSAS
jgi:ergothioneine biosynthesis protein EgtB